MTTAGKSKKIQFILKIAESFHRYGTPSYRIESACTQMAKEFGLKADFFSTPTTLISSFKSEDMMLEETHLSRLEPGNTDLDRLSQVDKVADTVFQGEMDIELGLAEVDAISSRPSLYSKPLNVLSYAILSMNLAVFIGGSLNDIFASCVLGGLVGILSVSGRMIKLRDLTDVIASFLASFLSYLWLLNIDYINPNIVILSSLISLLPGLTLTISIAELSTQNFTAGTSRLMGSIMTLLKLTFGVFLARQIISINTPLPKSFDLNPIASGWKLVALPLATLAFTINFKARIKDAHWIMLAGSASYLSSLYASKVLGTEFGVFIGALVVGALSNLFARIFKRPALMILLPGIILLVPGSVGFKGLNFMFEKDILGGVDAAFGMLKLSTSIVAGFLIGNTIINPRRSI